MTSSPAHLGRGGFATMIVIAGLGIAALDFSPRLHAADALPPLEKEIDAFVASKEKTLQANQKSLLTDIKKFETAVRRSSTDPDQKKAMLDHIQADYNRCSASNEFPSSHELIEVALQASRRHQKILFEIDGRRKKLPNPSIQAESSDIARKKLDELEKRVAGIMGDRTNLEANDKWFGHRLGPLANPDTLQLHIGEVTGGSFRGQLHQTPINGNAIIMKVEGTRTGNEVVMQTKGMIQGAHRELRFEGYVLGTRIVAKVSGTQSDKKPAGGYINLRKR